MSDINRVVDYVNTNLMNVLISKEDIENSNESRIYPLFEQLINLYYDQKDSSETFPEDCLYTPTILNHITEINPELIFTLEDINILPPEKITSLLESLIEACEINQQVTNGLSSIQKQMSDKKQSILRKKKLIKQREMELQRLETNHPKVVSYIDKRTIELEKCNINHAESSRQLEQTVKKLEKLEISVKQAETESSNLSRQLADMEGQLDGFRETEHHKIYARKQAEFEMIQAQMAVKAQKNLENEEECLRCNTALLSNIDPCINNLNDFINTRDAIWNYEDKVEELMELTETDESGNEEDLLIKQILMVANSDSD